MEDKFQGMPRTLEVTPLALNSPASSGLSLAFGSPLALQKESEGRIALLQLWMGVGWVPAPFAFLPPVRESLDLQQLLPPCGMDCGNLGSLGDFRQTDPDEAEVSGARPIVVEKFARRTDGNFFFFFWRT